MTLDELIETLTQIKEKENAILTEFTIFDDGSGMVYVDYDDPEKDNTEMQFSKLSELSSSISELLNEKKGGEEA